MFKRFEPRRFGAFSEKKAPKMPRALEMAAKL